MARVKCPDCNKKVSEKAEACPKCGYPIKTNIKEIRSKERIEFLLGFLVLVVIVVLIVIFSSSEEGEKETKPKTPQRTYKISSEKTKKDNLVMNIQKRLSLLGYEVGDIDGIYGPKTKSAILMFQKEYNLPPDGNISETLLKHLDEAFNTKTGLAEPKKEKMAQPGFPRIGNFYVIRNKGLESAIATSKNSWDKFMECLMEKDVLGIYQMIEREELIAVEDGAKVQVLDIPGWFSYGTAKIRIGGENTLDFLVTHLHPIFIK